MQACRKKAELDMPLIIYSCSKRHCQVRVKNVNEREKGLKTTRETIEREMPINNVKKRRKTKSQTELLHNNEIAIIPP